MVLFLGTDVINKKSPQDNLASCFYNHNELDLRNGFFREEVEWPLSGPCTSTPSKRKKYVCKYQQFWEKEFTWLKKSDTGEDMAHCKLCNANFSVAAGALYDVKRHAKRSTHVTAVEASSKTKSITNFVDDKKSSSVILSETLFSNFVAEHNLPFSLADHFTKLLPK